MTRINTNVPSMLARRVLNLQNKQLTTSLERLSTGMRINRGSDDPAGLIASEALRAENKAIASAIGNAQRAEQVVNVAEGGLQEINNLLVELQSLVSATANDAGVSIEEKEANQLQIDSILQTIDRIANSTTFNGSKLLNGNFDYTTTGVDTTVLDQVQINSARLSDTAGATLDVTVNVVTAASTATVFLSTGANLDASDQGQLTIEITGIDGVQQFSFASGTALADVVTGINAFAEALGVSAVASGATVNISSTGYGTNSFVRAKILTPGAGNFILDDSGGNGSTDIKDFGANAVVTINGITATTDGLKARVSNDGFDVAVTINGTSTLNADGQTESFQITGGGATFNLAPDVSLSSKVSLGISTMTSGNLGDAVTGFLSNLKAGGTSNVLNGNLSQAQKIVDSAIKQVSTLRGRLGAFSKNVVGSTINNLGVTLENTTAAESAIRDTEFAVETASLTRQQILSQAATQALNIANSQPQSVLALLQ